MAPAVGTWTSVRQEELGRTDLNDEQRNMLIFSTAEDVLLDIKKMDEADAKSSRTRQWLDKGKLFVDNFEKVAKYVDVFAGADSNEVFPLVWGSIRVVMAVAKDLQECFNEFCDFQGQVGNEFARLQAYEALTTHSERVHSALHKVFTSFLNFTDVVVSTFQARSKKTSRKWTAMQSQVRETITNIKALCEEAYKETDLAVKQSNARALGDIDNKLDSMEAREFGQWLGALTLDDQSTLSNSRLNGSCDWVLDNQDFRSFLSIEPGLEKEIFWISGAPGIGKSCISSFLIDHLRQKFSVAYFFCKTDDAERRQTIGVIKTIAWQFYRDSSYIPVRATRGLFGGYGS